MSDSRLVLDRIPNREDADLYALSRRDGDDPVPLDLFGTALVLFVQQVIRVIDADEGPGALDTGKHIETLSYRYRLQDGDDPLIRWEYDRVRPRPDYPYPLAHVHVHGELPDGSEAKQLHIPTQRVPLEIVLWFLLSEERFGLKSKNPDWEQILRDSIQGFRERRTTRD